MEQQKQDDTQHVDTILRVSELTDADHLDISELERIAALEDTRDN